MPEETNEQKHKLGTNKIDGRAKGKTKKRNNSIENAKQANNQHHRVWVQFIYE